MYCSMSGRASRMGATCRRMHASAPVIGISLKLIHLDADNCPLGVCPFHYLFGCKKWQALKIRTSNSEFLCL